MENAEEEKTASGAAAIRSPSPGKTEEANQHLTYILSLFKEGAPTGNTELARFCPDTACLRCF